MNGCNKLSTGEMSHMDVKRPFQPIILIVKGL